MKSHMLIAACIATSLACSLAAAHSAPSTSQGAMPTQGNATQGTVDAMFVKNVPVVMEYDEGCSESAKNLNRGELSVMKVQDRPPFQRLCLR